MIESMTPTADPHTLDVHRQKGPIMAITLTAEGQFFNTEKAREMGIFAKQTKGGRWQYRIESHKGGLVAAGMDPAAFVKRYWMRDDFEG